MFHVDKQRRFMVAAAKICDCGKNKDVDALYDLYLQISGVIRKPDEVFMKREHYELLMAGIIQTAFKLKSSGDPRCQKILQEMAMCPNTLCRLVVCSCGDDYSRFLSDMDERVVKVATIRRDFDQKWQTAPLEYKKGVMFFAKALEYGLIDRQLGFDLEADLDSQCVTYGSILFDIPDGQRIIDPEMDEDVFRYVTDLRIQGDAIYRLVCSGVLKLKGDVEQTEECLARFRNVRAC